MKFFHILLQSWLVLVFLFTSGCGTSDLPDYNKLDSLRVINIVANTPEVSPGDTVTLTPWVSDSKGSGRALTYSAAACPDPGVGYGAEPTCEGSSKKVVLATDLSVAGLNAANAYTGPVNTLSVTIPSLDVVFAGHRPVEIYNGVAYLVTYTLKAANGPTLKSFKRIIVSSSTKGAKNSNPTFNRILADESEISSYPDRDVDFKPEFAAGSEETYTAKQDDGAITSPGTDITLTEELTTTWFITAGSVDRQRTIGTQITKFSPEKPKPDVFRIIGVVRDGRGGVGIKDYTF